ncbi:hypothetical protein D9756_006927 [Leucocoprinus leucothites]|uniref:Arylamine N-acetyltransferase n=1 Tax=Leucocoprinus leucothites TaxID=201217 RepID=A0A8H5D5Y3_9AGAR|nr:hypothetical protein D9756_006927 [Leucoagaricus leucothites]
MISQPYPANGTLRDGVWIKRVPSRFTPNQLADYLSAIGYDPLYDTESISSGAFPINPETLERLVRLHLLTFPFENTSMHYTAEHDMEVTPELLLPRFVQDKNGSYCFGHNGVMLEVLRGLGFRAYAVGARVNQAPTGSPYAFGAYTHLILLVQPSSDDNQTYVIDVGIGSACLMRPLLLSTDPNNIVYGLTETERHRLAFEPNPNSSLSSSPDMSVNAGGQWNIEVGHRKSLDAPEIWGRQFAFTESECWHPDIAFSSFVVSKRPGPYMFWNHVTCVKVFTVDEGPENERLEKSKRPMYRIILHGKEVKKSYGVESELLRIFGTELDRIQALREIFGIKLRDEDEVYIKGRAAALSP